MSKRSKAEDPWNDLSLAWPEDSGPDPRIRGDFVVYSSDKKSDPTDPFGDTLSWSEDHNTLKSAINAYKKRIRRPETQECDIQLNLKFGGHYMTIKEPIRPSFPETYIYLTRWRRGGAFVESYHLNEIKFSERNHGKRTDELHRTADTPGLMSHYVEEAKKRQKK